MENLCLIQSLDALDASNVKLQLKLWERFVQSRRDESSGTKKNDCLRSTKTAEFAGLLAVAFFVLRQRNSFNSSVLR